MDFSHWKFDNLKGLVKEAFKNALENGYEDFMYGGTPYDVAKDMSVSPSTLRTRPSTSCSSPARSRGSRVMVRGEGTATICRKGEINARSIFGN